jgi:hypothetical protein
MWIGSDTDAPHWPPLGFLNVSKDQIECQNEYYFECQLNVYQAKIRAGFEHTGLANPQLITVFDNKLKATKTVENSLSPVWNEVFFYRNVKITALNFSRLTSPFVMLALYDQDRKNVKHEH